MAKLEKESDEYFWLFGKSAEMIEAEFARMCERIPPYSEPFRPLNDSELYCIKMAVLRGRIPESDPLNTHGLSAKVHYQGSEFGLTTCIIVVYLVSDVDVFTRMLVAYARLNPIDSWDKSKGQKLAFYRAVTESEEVKIP